MEGGPYDFFDASEDSLAFSAYTTFEMKHLLALPDALPHALRYIFHRIESRFDGSPTLIVQDECHLLHADPTFSVENIKYCKEGRRFNVATLFASQELFYLQALHTWQAMKGAIKTWLWTPNDKAEDADVTAFYASCGLSPHHCAVLARSTPKQDYLYQSDAGMRRFQLTLSPIERLLCAASTVDEIAQLRSLSQAPKREPLPAAWLRLNGYFEEADIYNDHYVKDQKDEKVSFTPIAPLANRELLPTSPRTAVHGTNGVHVHASG
jgi:type IV secretion system protein VirB4